MPDPHGVEEDGMNETILPCDFETARRAHHPPFSESARLAGRESYLDVSVAVS